MTWREGCWPRGEDGDEWVCGRDGWEVVVFEQW